MELTIRTAVPQDYAQVEAIMKQVHTLHVGWRPDIYRDVETVMPFDFFQELVSRGGLLVAADDDRVIGLVSFQFRLISGGPVVARKVLFVDSLAILDEHRGMGVGRTLLDRVTDIAREQGCDGVELQVNARNEEAMQMYQHCGFTEKSINMELPF